MTIKEFIRKYGTGTVPMVLKRCAETSPAGDLLKEIANDLQTALEQYAVDNMGRRE